MSPTSRACTLSLFLPLLVAACAKGGGEERPQSDVRFTASHHLFGFASRTGFGAFPVNPNLVVTDRGVLNLFDDSSYTITKSGVTSGADTYALAKSGALSMLVTGTGRDPSVVFVGGYLLEANGTPAGSANLFFTDRVTTTASPSVGLFVGTKVLPGQVELEGAWHFASLHLILNATVLSPDNVGRAVWGSIAVGAGAPGTVRTLSGTGQQTSSTVTFGGSIQNLLQNNVGDGACNLTIDYTVLGQPADSRVFQAAAGAGIVLGLDAEVTDGEAGLAFLVRKFDAPATPVDPAQVAGTFLVGGYTAFVNPVNMGSDGFTGVVTLSSPNGFRLDAVGSQGADFSYQGTYTLAADGGLTIAINGTNETWHGAIDRAYDTLMLVDDFQETRSNGLIELNLAFGVRRAQ